MRVKYDISGDTLTLYLIGELDEHYAKGAKDYIDAIIDKENAISAVIFELSQLTFMDSTGIGMLLGRYKKLKKRNVRCYIASPSQPIEKVLSLAAIYEVIPKM